MEWTNQSKIAVLLRLPWTIDSSTEDGERVLRVRELPSVVVSGIDEAELIRDFWDSLRESLAAYLHFGDPIPLPGGVRLLPWDPGYGAKAEALSQFVLRVTPKGTAQVRIENAETTHLTQAAGG